MTTSRDFIESDKFDAVDTATRKIEEPILRYLTPLASSKTFRLLMGDVPESIERHYIDSAVDEVLLSGILL
jgi:hypothetical protein